MKIRAIRFIDNGPRFAVELGCEYIVVGLEFSASGSGGQGSKPMAWVLGESCPRTAPLEWFEIVDPMIPAEWVAGNLRGRWFFGYQWLWNEGLQIALENGEQAALQEYRVIVERLGVNGDLAQ